jgi:hypothetical protein
MCSLVEVLRQNYMFTRKPNPNLFFYSSGTRHKAMKIIQQRPNLRRVMLTHRQTNVEYVDFLTADTELHTDSSMTKLDVFTHVIRSLYHTRSSALMWLHILNWVRGSERLNLLISGFHRALLESITFIFRLMHSITQNLEVKIYVV